VSEWNFYKPLRGAGSDIPVDTDYNFDSPDAIDYELFIAIIEKLVSGESVYLPRYNLME
jgi:uridine kinase